MTEPAPVIVLAGPPAGSQPPWLDALQTAARTGFRLRHQTERQPYVSRLADELAALVIVDADTATDPDWVYWTATPKSSPATRRIPVIVLSTDAALRRQAVPSGAELALDPAEFAVDCARFLREFARVPDPERMQTLDCECEEALPELAQQGVEKFNAGAFYKQHDLFEELWMATDGPVRDLYRAILQVGVAYYQIERGNHRGARKMLLRSVQWLAVLPDRCQGIDVKALREDSARVRAELEQLPEDAIDQFDKSLLQPVKRV